MNDGFHLIPPGTEIKWHNNGCALDRRICYGYGICYSLACCYGGFQWWFVSDFIDQVLCYHVAVPDSCTKMEYKFHHNSCFLVFVVPKCDSINHLCNICSPNVNKLTQMLGFLHTFLLENTILMHVNTVWCVERPLEKPPGSPADLFQAVGKS